jgi:hypothetical protein
MAYHCNKLKIKSDKYEIKYSDYKTQRMSTRNLQGEAV